MKAPEQAWTTKFWTTQKALEKLKLPTRMKKESSNAWNEEL